MTIGKLQSVELHETWSQGEKDFTNWLSNNLDILGEAIGLELEEPETEYSWESSNFKVDIVAKTKERQNVVIENQLDPTDHKHLGQIMTYMINIEAKIAVWISKQVRPEHIKVIEWLNEYTGKDFYLIQLESYKIDNSKSAPYFKVICKPSAEMKALGKQKKAMSEAEQLKIKFWESFLEKAKNKTNFFSNDRPHWWTQRYNKVGTSSIEIGCGVNADKTSVLVRFTPELKDIFFNLKKSLETEIGFKLEEKNIYKSRGYVKSNKEGFLKWFSKGGYRSPESEWDQIQKEMIDHFVKLEKSLKPMLSKLKPFKEVA